MVKSLKIKNFKKFSNEIKIDFDNHKSKSIGKEFIIGESISSVVGIIGKNASGKSTIAEAISFYKSFTTDNFNQSVFKKALNEKISVLMKKLNKNYSAEKEKLISKEIKLIHSKQLSGGKYDFTEKELFVPFKRTYLELSNNENKPIIFEFEYLKKTNVLRHRLEIEKTKIYESIIINNKKIHNDKNYIYNFQSKLLEKMKDLDFLKIEFLDFKSFIDENYEMIDYLIKDYIDKDSKLFLSFLKVVDEKIESFTYKKSGHPIAYFSSESNKKLDFNSLSKGTKFFINLYSHIYDALYVKKSFLIIDEIENSLHFALIKFIITIFKKRYNKLNSQLLFTTHNPYIFDEDFKSNSIYLLENDGIHRNDQRFDKKIAPSYFKGELVSQPNYKYRFEFLKKVLKDNGKKENN